MARALANNDVFLDLEGFGVDPVQHAGGFGGVYCPLAIRAHRHASGSIPTSIWARTSLVSTSTTVTIASSSLAMYRCLLLGCRENCSGSSPEGKVSTILRVARSKTCTVSSSLAQM